MGDPFELYFREYAAAFDAFDAEEIASYLHCPCLLVNADVTVPLTTREAIVSHVRGLLSYHRAQGYGRAVVSDVVPRVQAPRLAIVEMGWKVFRPDESLLWEWDHSYNLVDHEGRWRILVSTTHGPL